MRNKCCGTCIHVREPVCKKCDVTFSQWEPVRKDDFSILVCKECFSKFDSTSDKPCCPERNLVSMSEAYDILHDLYFKLLKDYIKLKFGNDK